MLSHHSAEVTQRAPKTEQSPRFCTLILHPNPLLSLSAGMCKFCDVCASLRHEGVTVLE